MDEFDKSVTTIDILRHGECEGGAIFRGSKDVDLSARGLSRMQSAAARIGAQDVIITSPLKRCHAFAKGLAFKNGSRLIVDARFREMYLGEWQGRTIESVWATQGDLIRAWHDDPGLCTPPGGEDLKAVQDRIISAWEDLIQYGEARRILLVTHSFVIRALLARLLNLPSFCIQRLKMPYGCRCRVELRYEYGACRPYLAGYNMDTA